MNDGSKHTETCFFGGQGACWDLKVPRLCACFQTIYRQKKGKLMCK